MNKLTKRILAILLTVCSLFGLIAVPAAATDGETSATTPKTFTYDFTILSNLTGTTNNTSEDVFWGDSSSKLYGFGGLSFFNMSNHQKLVVNSFYENDNFSWTYKSTGEEFSTDIALNWMPYAIKHENYEKDDGTLGALSSALVGGYARANKNNRDYCNGINITPKRWDYTNKKAIQTTGWVAIKIEAPEIGTYTVDLDYTRSQYGSKEASVYVLPGVLTEAEIEEAIANGTGKLKNTVDFYAEKFTETLSEESIAAGRPIYELPMTNYAETDSDVVKNPSLLGKLKSNAALGGNEKELGTITISEPADEYTVIFSADKTRSGGTDNNQSYMHLDCLTFTEIGERASASGTVKTYDFNRNTNGITADMMRALGTTGTADSTEGGYPILTADTTGVTLTSLDKGLTQPGKTIKANYNMLRYYNGFTTSSKALSAAYFVTELDKSTTPPTATIDKTAVGITNYNMSRLLESNYDNLGWKILGSTSGANASYFAMNDYLYAYNMTVTSGRPDGNYLAIQIKSPGEGRYKVDLGIKHATASGFQVRHMGMNVYIKEASSAGIEVNDYVVKYNVMSDYDAYYNPVYADDGLGGQYAAAPLTDASTGGDFYYEFEADKEYVILLQPRAKDKDGNTVSYFDSKKPLMIGEKKFYSSTAIWLQNIVCTPDVDTIATSGVDYTPKTYATGRWTGMAADVAKWMEDGQPVVLTDDTITNAAVANSKNVYYLRSSGKELLTTTAMPSGTFAYHKSLIDLMNNLYNSGDINWKILDFVERGGDIRLDNGAIVAYTMKATQTDGVCNTLAFKIRSPGEGNYRISFNLSNQAAKATAKVNGTNVAHEVKSCHLWMNAYLVKIEGEITEDDFKTVKPATPLGEIVQDYFYENTTSSKGSIVPVTIKGDELSTPVDFYFEEGAEYILYLEGHEAADTELDRSLYNDDGTPITEGVKDTYSSAGLYLKDIQFECLDEATQAVDHSTLAAALAAAAETGEIVKLQKDVVINELTIPENVTLDLNGYNLSIAAVAPMGKLVGDGLLKTYATTSVNAELMAENTLPLYDNVARGYRLYKYTYTNAQTEEADNDTVKFWYQLLFEDAAAYDIIESGTSGLQLGINLTTDNYVTKCVFANSKQTGEEILNDANAWAAAYATFAKATLAKGKTPWLYVDVIGASAAQNISVAPVITAGNADYALAAIDYAN